MWVCGCVCVWVWNPHHCGCGWVCMCTCTPGLVVHDHISWHNMWMPQGRSKAKSWLAHLGCTLVLQPRTLPRPFAVRREDAWGKCGHSKMMGAQTWPDGVSKPGRCCPMSQDTTALWWHSIAQWGKQTDAQGHWTHSTHIVLDGTLGALGRNVKLISMMS